MATLVLTLLISTLAWSHEGTFLLRGQAITDSNLHEVLQVILSGNGEIIYTYLSYCGDPETGLNQLNRELFHKYGIKGTIVKQISSGIVEITFEAENGILPRAVYGYTAQKQKDDGAEALAPYVRGKTELLNARVSEMSSIENRKSWARVCLGIFTDYLGIP